MQGGCNDREYVVHFYCSLSPDKNFFNFFLVVFSYF